MNSLTLLPILATLSLCKDNRVMIMDMDPGADDAMALLMMLSKNAGATVLAVTVVSGNTGIENATINTVKTLRIADKMQVPVYSGSDQGLVFKTKSDGFFGEDGFGDFDFPKLNVNTAQLRPDHAAEIIVKIVRSFPGQISLLALGPLTNVALALHLYPPLLSKLRELIILGSSYQGRGNVKPGVEFNFYSDPEAASLVISKLTPDCRATVFPMETVEEAAFSKHWRSSILGGLRSSAIQFLNMAERKSLARSNNWGAYDPMAAAYAIDSGIVLSRMKVDAFVETSGNLRGAFVINYHSNTTKLEVITKINQTRLAEIIMHTLS